MAQGTKMDQMSVVYVVMMISMVCAGAAAQSSCTNALMSLSPCLDYISGNSSSVPSSECCTQLASVVRSQPQCLCEVLNGGVASSLGITINQTQALSLPAACNVQTPPISNCKAATPAESPNSGPSGTGSTENGSSATKSVKLSIPLLFFVLAATYAPTFATHIL